jgi:hypothetical protein
MARKLWWAVYRAQPKLSLAQEEKPLYVFLSGD